MQAQLRPRSDRSRAHRHERWLQLLLAGANGAHILSAEWLTASREAGRWLPEADFTAEVRTGVTSLLASHVC